MHVPLALALAALPDDALTHVRVMGVRDDALGALERAARRQRRMIDYDIVRARSRP